MIIKILCSIVCVLPLLGAIEDYDDNVWPVVVLGAGPAGLNAALYAVRGGFPTKVLTGPLKGGQLMGTTAVENYAGVKKIQGGELTSIMEEQAVEFGAEVIDDAVTSVDLGQWPFIIRTENGLEKKVFALIIATGATPKMLGVPGEETYFGSGISTCAKCDCRFFTKKDVFVVGGGDSAIEEAMHLSAYANSVTVLVRGERMRAAHLMKEKLIGYPKIRVQLHTQVTQIIGNGKKVTHLELLDALTGRKTMVKADGLFLAIGHKPHADLFKGQLELTEHGYIVCKERSQETSVPGVYAAGDVEDPYYRQAIVAAAAGCKAAIDAGAWLRKMGVTEDVLDKYRK